MATHRPRSTGTCSTTRRTPACATLVRDLNRLVPRARPRCTSATASRPASSGSPTTTRRRVVAVRALGRRARRPRGVRLQLHAGARHDGYARRRARARGALPRGAQHRLGGVRRQRRGQRTASLAADGRPVARTRRQSSCLTLPPLATHLARAGVIARRAARSSRACPTRSARPGTATGVNFALFSRTPSASSCACSTRAAGASCARIALPEYTDEVWHGYLPDARPGHALRLPRLRPVRSRARPPLQPPQAAARPLRQGADRGRCAGATRTTATASARRRRDLSFDRRDNAGGHAQVRACVESAFTWGDDQRPRVPWTETVFYELHVKGFTDAAPRRAAGAARHVRAALADAGGRSRTCTTWASPRSSCCRCRPSSTTARWSRSGCATTGATTRSASSRPTRATCRAAIPTSSRRWSSTCTRRASRSCSTSSTTTPPRATSSARRSRSAASTTPRTTASRRTRATTTT